MERRINKFFSILLVLCMILSMMPAAVFAASTPSVVYLKPNSEWLTASARFAVYFYNSDTDNVWVNMTDSDGDGFYEANVPSGYAKMIYCRMDPGTTQNAWSNKWNQTGDLSIPTNGNNCYTMNSGSWDTGAWGVYSNVLEYYLIGYINGANYGCEEDAANMGSYKFSNGKLKTTFAKDSYVFVKTSNNAKWYMTQGYQQGTSATLYNTADGITSPNKLFVPGNVEVTFTLTENSDGTLTLAYTANTCEHSYTSAVTSAAACSTGGVRTYTCSGCGDTYTETIPAIGHSYTNGVCSVCGYSEDNNIRIHLINTLGWDGVVGYAWIIKGSTTSALNGVEWPGQAIRRNADGTYTMELEYEPVSGESLGVTFHNFNGSQTADVTLSYTTLRTSHDIWVKPSTTANSEGKFNCTTATSKSGLIISPEISGKQVTFRYQNTSASKVYLAGSMNNWSTSANKMTKGSDGVWSITLTLEPGIYEYKFVADSKWYVDPSNGVKGGYDGNSVVVVPATDTPENTGKITVMLHFYRESGDYTGWDVWFWDNQTSGASAFKTMDGDKGMVATYVVDGDSNTKLGYLVRKTDWSSKEFYDRFIDLSDVISGTVHYYVTANVAAGTRVLGGDVVLAAKPSYAQYQFGTNAVWLKTALPLGNVLAGDFKIVDESGNATNVTVTGVKADGNGYTLTLSRSLTLAEMSSYQIKYGDYYATLAVKAHDLFYSSEFAAEYTYYGDDLGANWSAESTTFKVWAPTAIGVAVRIYASGTYANNDELKYVTMAQGEKGVWAVTVPGDWNGKYYNYVVTFPTYSVEATDPYAKSTGANGDRGMILNMDTTDPEGWENDISPNLGMSYTDAIIYELHVREFTIDSSSGVKSAWKGKYLGLTQSGTKYNDRATGLDHLKELGVTHVQLMPVYDYNSVDEYHLTDWQQYAWGYDPKNYNVPEGSYSTDPFDGSVRVTEFKEMVQTFHENGINVVMDVVYNHAFDGGNFCYNKIVPNYFCRFYGEGNWSNGSGCGNDIATERSMARNYIVDSILHWVEEYHIDGFRFDLVGLIDTQTINEVVNTVHAKYPYVMFYGEGWAPGDTAVEYGYDLTTQGNAWKVGGFGFFNDSIRNAIAGNNGGSWGFASGSGDFADAIGSYFRASNGWSTSPTQTINYVSCHDNYCLTDKLCISRNGAYWSELAAMNRLSAAMVMMAQGTPFLYSGDELLREKKDEKGNRYDNAYGTNDYINKIRWSDLVEKEYAQVNDDYYAGLIAFRKNHAALRCPSGADAWNYVTYHKIDNNCILFYVNGYPNYECSDGICIIFNGSGNTKWVDLYGKIPAGDWQACIHGDKAGAKALWSTKVTSSSGNVGVEPYSATVLVLGDLVHEESVYNNQPYQCSHTKHNTSGMCTKCGATVDHTYVSGKCSVCGLAENAPDTYTVYYDNSETKWSSVSIYSWTTTANVTKEYTNGWAGSVMTHVGNNIYAFQLPIEAQNVIFNDGGSKKTDDLTAPGYTSTKNLYSGGVWTTYEVACSHNWKDATCTAPKTCSKCGATEGEALKHDYQSAVTAPTCTKEGYTTYTCSVCGDNYKSDTVPATGEHNYVDGICTGCGVTEPVKLPVLEPTGATLSLEGEVMYKVYFTVDDPSSIKSMGMLTFNAQPANGNIENADEVISKVELVNGTYIASSNGIPAKMLGDEIYICLYAQLEDGTYVYSRVIKYSGKIYADYVLDYRSDDPALQQVVVAMLNYGAEAQTFFGYKTDSLMNADLTESEKNMIVDYNSTLVPSRALPDAGKTSNFPKSEQFSYRSASMVLEGALAINYRFVPSLTPASGLTLYYWTEDTYNSVDALSLDNIDGQMNMEQDASGYYTATYDGLAAKQMGDVIYIVAVYESNGETHTTGVIAYSLYTYCNDAVTYKQPSAEIAKAAAVYGYYAENYFGNR